MMNTEQKTQGAEPVRCFWDHSHDARVPDRCPNYAQREIYWDGKYELICNDCFPEAEEVRRDILSNIDDHYWS